MRFVSTLAALLATFELRCKNRQEGQFQASRYPEHKPNLYMIAPASLRLGEAGIE
jgi:hypothetical protein